MKPSEHWLLYSTHCKPTDDLNFRAEGMVKHPENVGLYLTDVQHGGSIIYVKKGSNVIYKKQSAWSVVSVSDKYCLPQALTALQINFQSLILYVQILTRHGVAFTPNPDVK